jgi:hypothetical protein
VGTYPGASAEKNMKRQTNMTIRRDKNIRYAINQISGFGSRDGPSNESINEVIIHVAIYQPQLLGVAINLIPWSELR